jgi:asparagine synthase (glutamine-hydrolysing)
MCGIVGIIQLRGETTSENVEQVLRGIRRLKHRGPDGMQYWTSPEFCVAHARLSIFDNSPAGSQPFVSARAVVACNGEIYNYQELAATLGIDPHCLRSDCEIVLRGYERWGISVAERLRGDFAFALFDRVSRKSYLVRDHAGVKQLVYTRIGDVIAFASEAKALASLNGFKLEPSVDKIAEDWLMGFWGDKSSSYFESVYHINQGCFLECSPDGTFREVTYWAPETIPAIPMPKDVLVERLNDTLKTATEIRLMGGAKLGTLLSGGIDSSLTSAITANALSRVNSYTTTYSKSAENEDLLHAELVAKASTNIDHKRVDNLPEDFSWQNLSTTSYHMEEVVWDRVYWAILNNYRAASADGHRVIISGQGADELWLGYFFTFPHYRVCGTQWQKDYLINEFSQDALKFRDALNPSFLDSKRARDIVASNIERNLLPYGNEDKLNGIAHWAFRTHLQSNLMQEDRLSMASSVECRVPQVDVEVVKLAYSTPSSLKLLDGREKYPVRQVASRWLPSKVASRNKFHFPESPDSYNREIHSWLQDGAFRLLEEPILSAVFKEETLKCARRTPSLLPPQLVWRLVAIANFSTVFDTSDSTAQTALSSHRTDYSQTEMMIKRLS